MLSFLGESGCKVKEYFWYLQIFHHFFFEKAQKNMPKLDFGMFSMAASLLLDNIEGISFRK